MTAVVVLNASYEPHDIVSFEHAVRMLVRQVAVVEEAAEGMIGKWARPKVVRLVRYVYAHWKTKTAPRFTREGMLKRDNYTCRYCRGFGDTMDHVVPESRGGETSWLNCVTACWSCNNMKDDRTPEEAGMRLLWEIYEPKRTR